MPVLSREIICLAFPIPPAIRPGRDEGVRLHCTCGGLPVPQTDCQVPQTSLICTSIELSPCSEHLVRCGRSAVVLGSGVRD